MINNLSNQQKGSLLAFIGVMFITPDSLFIRLSSIETWGMLFYRGAIPFLVVLFDIIYCFWFSSSYTELPSTTHPFPISEFLIQKDIVKL